MVSTEKDFDKLADLYRELLFNTLSLHNVSEVVCENKKEHYFDKIVVKNTGLEVYRHGLSKPMDNLYYDFTNDFARCLSFIEDDLYLTLRSGKPVRGMVFTFNI